MTNAAAPITHENVARFISAGNARFTIVSPKTGQRFTYRVRQPTDDAPHFVSVLTGPDNDADYQFLGTIFDGARYAHGRKSCIGPEAPSAVAAAWFFGIVLKDGKLPAGLQVWHEGFCARCGRALTVPESIACGFGPECAEREGVARTTDMVMQLSAIERAAPLRPDGRTDAEAHAYVEAGGYLEHIIPRADYVDQGDDF